MKHLLLFAIIISPIGSLLGQTNQKEIKTGTQTPSKTYSTSKEPSAVYLHVESGTKTENPKTFEEQIKSYDLDQINQLLTAYQSKYDHQKDDTNQSSEYLNWSTDIQNKIASLLARKTELISTSEK